MLRTFRESVAIVTGGGSGIGVALGRELLARGAARVVLADIRLDAAESAPGIVNTPLFTHGAVRTARPASDEVVRSWKAGVKSIAPEDFARIALDGVAKNRELVHVPRAQGFFLWLLRCLPGLERALLARELARSRLRMPEMYG